MKTADLQKILHDTEPENAHVSKEIPLTNFISFENDTVKMDMNKCQPVQGFGIVKHGQKLATRLHNHNYFEIMYMFSGEMTHIIDGKKITLKQGDLIILPPYAYHSIEQCTASDIAVNLLMHKTLFNDAFMSSIGSNHLFKDFISKYISMKASNSKNSYLLLQTENDDRIRSYINMILCEYYDPNMCSAQIIRNLLPSLFNVLYHIWHDTGSAEGQVAATSSSTVFNILSYIEANYISVTLHSVAECFGYTPNYIGKLIKRATKKNFNELRHDLCMKEAAKLLIHSTLSANEISHVVGFLNSSFFYRLFHRHYKMTPNEYRELHALEKVHNRTVD